MGSIGRHIEAPITYVNGQIKGHIAGTVGARNYTWTTVPTTIWDARDIESSLDVQGFQLVSQPSKLPASEHSDAERIKAVVYPEAEAIIQHATGAARVYAFSHLVRTHRWQDLQAQMDDKSNPDTQPLGGVPPSRGAHIDHSAEGAVDILRDNYPDAEKVLQSGKRWAIINLWRPIKPIERDPLCLCDARTVEEKDLRTQTVTLPNDKKFGGVSKGRTFDSLSCSPNPKHDWYYCSDMQPEEAWLLKIFDSNAGKNGIVGGTPHSAFELPGSLDRPARSSYELRALVFYD